MSGSQFCGDESVEALYIGVVVVEWLGGCGDWWCRGRKNLFDLKLKILIDHKCLRLLTLESRVTHSQGLTHSY